MEVVRMHFPRISAASPDILTYDKLDAKIGFLILKPHFRRAKLDSIPSRLPQHRITLRAFQKLLETLDLKQKKKLLFPLLFFHQFLLRKTCRVMRSERKELRITVVQLLMLLAVSRHKYDGLCFEFLSQCVESLTVKPDVVLSLVPRSFFRFVLFGFLFKRFDRSPLTTKGALRTAVLNYGCLYIYNRRYFVSLCKEFLRDSVQVRGKSLSGAICGRILHNGNLRIQLAVQLLTALFDAQNDDKEHMLLSTLWKSTPFPFVTRDELSTLLSPFFHQDHISLKEVCDEFATTNTICPVPDVTQPRSLKHLSRVQILKELHVVTRVGDSAISGLPIPDSLKSYLMLDSF